jgi:AcrR family transcriptional regulator
MGVDTPNFWCRRRHNVDEMAHARPLRADAERNRRRLLAAAKTVFSERGLDVGVAEIAARAGVGRGTLFRNFASKQQLIAAIVSETMREATDRGRALLDAPDPGAALFDFMEELVRGQQTDRALVEAVADTFLADPEIAAAYAEFVGALEQLVARAQAAGAVRADIGALDIVMLIKGACEAANAFQHVNPQMAGRQLDLVRAALSTDPAGEPLRGRPPTLEDFEQATPKPDGAQQRRMPA